MFRRTASLILIFLMATNVALNAQSTETPSSQSDAPSAREAELKARFASRANLTQDDVDQLLKTYPQINGAIQELNPSQTPEMQEIMSTGVIEDTPYEALGTAFEGTELLQKLNTVAIENGYENFGGYAQKADYFYQVFISQSKTIFFASPAGESAPETPRIENLSAFLKDETQPAKKREQLQAQLSELYRTFHISDETHEIFAKNHDALMTFFNPPS